MARCCKAAAGLAVTRASLDMRIPRGETPAMGEVRP